MKKLYLSAIALSVFFAFTTNAAQFAAGERFSLAQEQIINDDLYITGGESTVNGTVNGDVFVFSGSVKILGTVNGDLFVAGGDVDISGDVGGSIRVVGGNIDINGKVGKDVLAAGGSIKESENAVVAGESYLNAGEVFVAGTTGKVKVNAGTLHVSSTAKINGDVSYASNKDARIDDGSTISGIISKKIIEKRDRQKSSAIWSGTIFSFIFSLISVIILTLIFNYIFPLDSYSMAQNWKNNFGRNLLYGFSFLFLTPFVIILLLVSVIGIPISFIVGLIYMFTIMTAQIVAVLAVGTWIYKEIKKDSMSAVINWQYIVLGATVIGVIGLIPIIGWLANFVVFLVALGVLVKGGYNRVSAKKI